MILFSCNMNICIMHLHEVRATVLSRMWCINFHVFAHLWKCQAVSLRPALTSYVDHNYLTEVFTCPIDQIRDQIWCCHTLINEDHCLYMCCDAVSCDPALFPADMNTTTTVVFTNNQTHDHNKLLAPLIGWLFSLCLCLCPISVCLSQLHLGNQPLRGLKVYRKNWIFVLILTVYYNPSESSKDWLQPSTAGLRAGLPGVHSKKRNHLISL